MEKSSLRKIIMSALMAAITTVLTMVIRIPSVGGTGYVNLGDAAVLLCAWMIGGLYGAFAAGLGSAMADLLAGYAYYVPGTFVIKFLMALVAYQIVRRLSSRTNLGPIQYALSAIPAELIMVCGYFLYKSIFLGKGFVAAFPSVFTNCVQAAVCIAAGVFSMMALRQVKGLNHV